MGAASREPLPASAGFRFGVYGAAKLVAPDFFFLI
jgi:hypothetical protein